MNLRISTVMVVAAALLISFLITRQPSISGSADANKKAMSAGSNPATKMDDGKSTPVLVELFTSEGCSSCPPADALLMRLGRTQPVQGADVIVLEEHVDYWDRLGWKDPFSSEAATARHGDYAAGFGNSQVYTPQMIVDGHTEFVGDSQNDALRSIRGAIQTPKPAVQLSWGKSDQLAIRIQPQDNAASRNEVDVYLIVAENMLHSDVKRGENAGRALEHDGVTRQFISLGKIKNMSSGFSSTYSTQIASTWNRGNLRAVVFAQDRQNHHVLAAGAIPFPSVS